MVTTVNFGTIRDTRATKLHSRFLEPQSTDHQTPLGAGFPHKYMHDFEFSHGPWNWDGVCGTDMPSCDFMSGITANMIDTAIASFVSHFVRLLLKRL